MGLCKCPKRQVTTQFCFEHRVNVCENCMVVNHTKCTVQSYIQWLKDSDFDSSCTLCGNPLDDEDCVRLICYHVFHWKCLNVKQQSLPANTAPGGHTCPTCSDPIFPPVNLVSPVADVLRTRLGQVNWARNVLELPLLTDDKSNYKNYDTATTSAGIHNGSTFASSMAQTRTNERPESPHSIVNMDSYVNNSSAAMDFHASSRRPLLARESPIGAADRDDNKYKRRTPQEIFSRWSRRLYAPSSKPPWRRTWFLVLGGCIGFVCIIYVLSILGRRGGDGEVGLIYNRNLPHEE